MSISDVCLSHSIRRADRVVSQFYNEKLAPFGIKITQFSVLKAIYMLETPNASQLGEALVMEQATVSRAVKPLLRDGFVVMREGEDRREKRMSLTEQGRALLFEASEAWLQAQSDFKAYLGEGIDDVLVSLNRKVVGLKR